MLYKVITPPAAEPVDLAAAKLHLRIDEADSSEDAIVLEIIGAAREYCEKVTRRALAEQTIEAYPDATNGLSHKLRLPCPPLLSVTSIIFKAEDGTETMLTPVVDYIVDSVAHSVMLTAGRSWPAAYCTVHPVTIRYTAGYNESTPMPKTLRQAMLLLIGHWYANRETVTVGTVSEKLKLATDDLLLMDRAGWW